MNKKGLTKQKTDIRKIKTRKYVIKKISSNKDDIKQNNRAVIEFDIL